MYAGGMAKNRREQARKPRGGKVYKRPRTGAEPKGQRYNRKKDK